MSRYDILKFSSELVRYYHKWYRPLPLREPSHGGERGRMRYDPDRGREGRVARRTTRAREVGK
jgi:hypothetical protein